MPKRIILPGIVLAGLVLASCGGGGGPDILPTFELQDVNPTSATFTDPVSTEDFLTMVAGIYFGGAL